MSISSKVPRKLEFPGGETAYKKALATLQLKYKFITQQGLKMKGKEPEGVPPPILEDDMAVG